MAVKQGTRRHRSSSIAAQVIALSISYERENLLERGLGLDHLRELLLSLARPLVRRGASLSYDGHWAEIEENFTYDLLRLISSEQEDNAFGGPDTNRTIGRLINHSAWPHYLDITPEIEARWINCCRILRVKQQDAGLSEAEAVPDKDAKGGSDQAVFNAAVALSAMRALSIKGMSIVVPDVGVETAPPPVARVLLGGKTMGYNGFLPGIFEEALLTLEAQKPLYVLGGFGGAAEVLAKALLAAGDGTIPEFTYDWHRVKTPAVARLNKLGTQFNLPSPLRTTSAALEALSKCVAAVRGKLAVGLGTGLDETETADLLKTRDITRAGQLVWKGLKSKLNLDSLPA